MTNNSASSSKSCSSSASPFLTKSTNKRSMEEVWKDITLSSLQEQEYASSDRHTSVTHHPVFQGMILQDFLALPSNKDCTPTRVDSVVNTAVFGSNAPATMLSLNFGSKCSCLEGRTEHGKPNPPMQSHVDATASMNNIPFDLGYDSICKKRASEDDGSCSDRRHKRMMKNRESAARSRARKQAYTTELELKVSHLRDENARLRRQQESFLLAAGSEFPKKRALFRTSTAPF